MTDTPNISMPTPEANADNLVRLAVFDLDGTCLDGSSTVRLVLDLLKKRNLGFGTGLIIGFWGLAYKLKLPQNESWVRTKLFHAFEGQPKEEADAFMGEYFDRVVEKIWRPQVQPEIDAHHDAGRTVMIVSASFEPIVLRACERHNVDYQISTRMKVGANGRYTNAVDGLPIEGEQKLIALRAFSDGRFGAGNWVCEFAYADHYSDIKLLEFAQNPYAVCPDTALRKHAEDNGWTILDWDIDTKKKGSE